MKKTLYTIATLLILTLSSGCLPSNESGSNSLQPRSPTTPNTNSPTPTEQPTTRPATKTATLRVEGEATPVTLKLFEQDGYPLTTYFPERFEPEAVASGEGQSIRFYLTQPDGTREPSVYVNFFFPSQNMSVEQMEEYLLEDNGIFSTNQWQVVDRASADNLPWAVERISFRHASDPRTLMGNVYVGQANGKAFSATVHYPAEYGDGMAPRTTTILENVQLR